MADWKQKIKQRIKKSLTEVQHRQYEQEVEKRNLTYDRWITQKEKELEIAESIQEKNARSQINDFLRQCYEQNEVENEGIHSEFVKKCCTCTFAGMRFLTVRAQDAFFEETLLKIKEKEADVILFSSYPGEISRIALPLIAEKFKKNKNIIVIYGDEDVQTETGRTQPWFKPDWSPDRFLSDFYFGALTAVRGDVFFQAKEEEKNETGLYAFLYMLLREAGGFSKHDGKQPAAHIRQVLYHRWEEGDSRLGKLFLSETAKNSHFKSFSKYSLEAGENTAFPALSIIIPSKDNPAVLFQCIHSLLRKTVTGHSYEIIIVDNGSSAENKREIEKNIQKLEKEKASETGQLKNCRYLYRPMEFNFSVMCNLGAEEAAGEILLFLNDDMEIIQPDFMERMLEKAMLSYVGCVGAKLLYPDSDMIQHAGITNLKVGPAHKLQFLSDKSVHYYGMNRGVHNMLGVTGACLMMRKEVFKEAGGFCEKLAVAFNDVDLCYTIYEKGYYNVVRNDVVLYHHESLSRGKDGESSEKQQRLLKEKDILYERHQDIYGKDPFYHPYLTNDMLESEYSPAYHYEVKLDMPWAEVRTVTAKVNKAREDSCLVVGMECAMDIYKWKYGVSSRIGKVAEKPEEAGYYFQGYSFVIGADNACYEKQLLLKNTETEEVFSIPVDICYRQDIRKNLKDQLNVDLTGFVSKVQKQSLPPGIYQFGMLARERYSRQKLVNWSSWVLEVLADE